MKKYCISNDKKSKVSCDRWVSKKQTVVLQEEQKDTDLFYAETFTLPLPS